MLILIFHQTHQNKNRLQIKFVSFLNRLLIKYLVKKGSKMIYPNFDFENEIKLIDMEYKLLKESILRDYHYNTLG